MAEERVQRRLAAILAADVVGYSRMMSHDEVGTLSRLAIAANQRLTRPARRLGHAENTVLVSGAAVFFCVKLSLGQ